MKTVKIAPVTINAENAATIQNNLVSDIIGFLNSEAEKVPAKKVKAEKAEKVQTYQQQLVDNKAYKGLLTEECRKLGYALSLMKKFEKAFSPNIANYVSTLQNDPILYQIFEKECKRSKSGNFTVWLIQSHMRNLLNA
jgi:hypothetical protein